MKNDIIIFIDDVVFPMGGGDRRPCVKNLSNRKGKPNLNVIVITITN